MRYFPTLLLGTALAFASLHCGDDDGTSSNDDDGNNSTTSTSTSASGGNGAGGNGSGGSGGVSDGSGGAGGSSAVTIPSPGNDAENWISAGDIGTPGMAWPVGVATQTAPYIEGEGDATSGNAFFVFEAGPALVEFTANVFGNSDFVHLHDGSGLVFGAEITPTASTVGSGTWTTVPGNIYVLEVHQPGGGFF